MRMKMNIEINRYTIESKEMRIKMEIMANKHRHKNNKNKTTSRCN